MPSVHITLPWKMNVSGETLFAAGPKEKNKLLSAALRFNKYGLPAGIRLGASQIETFGENRISGHHTILSTSKTFMQSLDMRLQGGFAKYEFIYSQAYWEYDIRTSIFHNMASSWYYSVSYDRTWGDVKPSNQYFVEIGTRFGK
jgi:hypothetical protein